MNGNSRGYSDVERRKTQLDKQEREHLETVVTAMRERIEDNVEFQLTRQGLDEKPVDVDALDRNTRQLVEAIELETVDGHDWNEAFAQYVDGVGYTIVNRLAALRCMEVRDFIDEEVTVFKNNGLTPAAETLVHEEFLLEDEAIVRAYYDGCDELAERIEILFDRSSAYSQIDPDGDTFEELCGMLDEVPADVWRADDVLGWVYEYYNRPAVESLDAKNTLEPDDVGPANQFYTPHWVVRMLADNSLGKLYLEATGKEATVATDISIEERKERLVTPEDAPGVPELCTYLIPDEEEQDAPSFDDPSELRVIDPACGSGHFLLYAFDILERIWWAERPDIDRGKIPAKILEHNLYGVDIDLRSCQLSAFNIYLKARNRAEEEDNDDFEMPNIGIVCADARVAEVESATDVFDTIAEDRPEIGDSLGEILEQFKNIEALGSLLDVQGGISNEFLEEQTSLCDTFAGPHTLNAFLNELRETVEERTSGSFVAQNLRSFLHLLVILTQSYDVALMNPPYGSRGRMPNRVQEYIQEQYQYTPEYYINFFEVCDGLVKKNGRVGMLVPRSFMFLRSFRTFRKDFIGGRGSFDFLAEFGMDILDNATVRTAGTVVRTDSATDQEGIFIRLGDVEASRKERSFLHSAFLDDVEDGVKRQFRCDLSEFDTIPNAPLSYWVPTELRDLYKTDTILDKKRAGWNQRGLGDIRQGIATGNDSRFLRAFWEAPDERWIPFAKGGTDAWLMPRITTSLLWGESGREVRYYPGGNGTPSEELYFEEGLTYTVAKESGKRFGYLPPGSIFGHKGSVLIPDRAIWHALSYTNSHLFTYLMIAQTTERMWEVGQVSKIPWRKRIEENDTLEALSREAIGHIVSKRQYDFTSPYYGGPLLLDVVGIDDTLPQYDHPHRKLREELDVDTPEGTVTPGSSLAEIATAAAKHLERIEADLQSCADAIDDAVFDCFDVDRDHRETVRQEIALRTNEDPREQVDHDPEAITEPTEEFPEMVRNLLLHLAIRAVHEDDDGIVPLSDVGTEPDLLDRIIHAFERLFGDHASARLAEVDQVLGGRSADEAAYPNLRVWLENDLFDYHVSTFDRTPILWQLTTERLVSDPDGEGFSCLVDYHQLDANVFDRLQNRYIEPRKSLLRERRSGANRRRGDASLSASAQAGAAEEYERCESGLEQVAAFEDKLADLAQPSPREWPEANRRTARNAAATVADFREETASRVETLEALADLDDVTMSDLFSPSFYGTVRKRRDEWLDALDGLEAAFKAYATDGSKPVESHLYDLFEQYDDVVGSAHYASNGILFMTYYFDKFDESDQAYIGDGGVSERRQYLSELAGGVETYRNMADEIAGVCDSLRRDIPSDWAERALSEISTAGYRPNHKFGVGINITPLADVEIVPKTVDEHIL